MWKWIILAVAAYALFRLFTNDWKRGRKGKEDEKAKLEKMVAAGEMVKDPECGTYIAADSGISVRDGETVYRFCSYDCRDAFVRRIQAGKQKSELPPERDA
jgi:YHS domain-containing protein